MKLTIKNTIKRLEKEKELLSKRRDTLREFLGEIQDLDDNCESAICYIEHAIDTLSELV